MYVKCLASNLGSSSNNDDGNDERSCATAVTTTATSSCSSLVMMMVVMMSQTHPLTLTSCLSLKIFLRLHFMLLYSV